MNAIQQNNEIMQNMLDELIRFEIVDKDETTASIESIVTLENLWKLFKVVDNKLSQSEADQNKELLEMQKYIENVRQLSEERDQLTSQFEEENEKLKSELNELKSIGDAEASEISDMCQQENLQELIGSSFSEQMAYLLVVRSTLLNKLEAMEEKNEAASKQCYEMDVQIKSLTSADGELRHRMEEAMAEMGGMALKLNDALKERDELKKKVRDLTSAVDGIQTLPMVSQAKAEASINQQDSENLKEFYSKKNNELLDELKQVKHLKESSEVELLSQIHDLEDMNMKLKEVNKKLHSELMTSDDNESRERVQADSQKIIDEMQQALDEDDEKNRAQQEEYEATINEMAIKISQLEAQLALTPDEDIDVVQLKAQLNETKDYLDQKCNEASTLQAEVRDLKREMIAREVASDSQDHQFSSQARILTELQDRNTKLEVELAKVVVQLKESHEKQMWSEKEKSEKEKKLEVLKNKIVDMESLLLRETNNDMSEKNQIRMEAEIAVLQAQVEEEKKIKNNLSEELASSQQRCHDIMQDDEELRRNLTHFQHRALNAEAESLLITSQKENEENQKMVAELNRSQLEDAVKMLRMRVDFYIFHLQSYVDKYKSLKQKHKTKIRRIRELFLMERKATSEEVERLERKLVIAEKSLEKELSWKEKAARNISSAEKDRRNAINKADQSSRIAEEKSEKIKQLNMSSDQLVSENSLLQKQLRLLQQQKYELERIIDSVQKNDRNQEFTQLLSSLSLSGSLPHPDNYVIQSFKQEN